MYDTPFFKDVVSWLRTACDMVGKPDLLGKLTVLWSNRLTSTAGLANYNYELKHGIITLSIPLWERATQEQRRETTFHEVAHIVTDETTRSYRHHGDLWRYNMLMMGYPNAKRCHSIPVERKRREKLPKYIYYCDCGKYIKLTHIKIRRMINYDRNYHCRSCKRDISINLDHPDYQWFLYKLSKRGIRIHDSSVHLFED